jgi:heat shock protein HtpX
MTVYNQIAYNKTRTYLTIFVFVLLVAGFFFLLGRYFESSAAANGYFVVGFIFATLSSVGSYFYADKIVLFTMGARPADKKNYFDYYTVTENLSIAAGLPMPKLYVIDDPSPNAFATGRDPKHAVVGATTGLLQKLDRAELEGVIAHELSHVKNYDILLSTIVAVLVGTIALVSDWMMRSFWWGGFNRDEDRRDRNPIVFLFVIIALILGPIIATLIQLAISRRREFLADASGALLTRYPEGLARALEKISADPVPMRHAASSTAHLFISNPFKKGQRGLSVIATLFSTHPPVQERIKVLRSM